MFIDAFGLIDAPRSTFCMLICGDEWRGTRGEAIVIGDIVTRVWRRGCGLLDDALNCDG